MTPPPPERRRRHPAWSVVRWVFRAVCAAVVVLDELMRPLFRPIARWFASLDLIRAMERRVARAAPLTVLAMLAVPLLIVEPLKFLSVFWAAGGHAAEGTTVFVLAYLVSFLVLERIYTAGRPQLMTLPLAARVVVWIEAIRASILALLPIAAIRRRVQVLVRWARRALR